MEANAKKVLDAMKAAGEPMRPGEIAEAAKMDRKDVDKIIKTLKADEKIVSPKRCFWEPA